MNYLAIDYGTKNIGLAYSVSGIIFTLPPILNDPSLMEKIRNLVNEYSIEKIIVGVSEGKVAKLTLKFVNELSSMLKLSVETVEESVSTIEAKSIIKNSKNKKQLVDSVSAAVILQRVIN